MTHRIKILWDAPGWAHWHRAKALQKYAPADFTVDDGFGGGRYTRDHYDLILILPMGSATRLCQHLQRIKHRDTVVVGALNIGDPKRATKWGTRMVNAGVKAIITNNAGCAEAIDIPTIQINNGVDLDLWGVDVPIADREPRVIWTGSAWHTDKDADRDTKRYWSILKPLAERLDVPCDFRRVESVGTVFSEAGLPVVRAGGYMDQAELRAFYNSGTVYVCASESEGTPNPALEAGACGCTVVSTPVGNMPELITSGVNGELVDHTLDAVEAGVRRARSGEAMQDTIRAWSWELAAVRYFDLFRRLLA